MSANHDLERRIADHYATEAPPRAPRWVLERILASVDATAQRRTVLGRPWRIPTMPSTLAKLGATAVAVAAIGVVGLALVRPPVFGPGPTTSPSPSSPSSPAPSSSLTPTLTERFDSTFNLISMDYPTAWETRPATEPWTSGAMTFGDPGVDVIFHPRLREDLYFAVASEALNGRVDHVWREGLADVCDIGGRGGYYVTDFDGAEGWITSCGGARSMIVATATRGYAVVLHLGNEELAQAYSSEWFDAVLETVELHPEEALDASSPSNGP